MHQQTLKLESVDASTDFLFIVGGCINRPMKYGLSYQLSTDCLADCIALYFCHIERTVAMQILSVLAGERFQWREDMFTRMVSN